MCTTDDLAFEPLGPLDLKNIARPVEAFVLRPAAAPHAAESAEAMLPGNTTEPLRLPDRPSIAVLAFTNMSGDPEQEYFADGMVEDIITALSRIRWLFVIARNSSLHLQRPGDRHKAGRPRARRPLRAGRLSAQGRQSRARHDPVDRCARPARMSGPTATTATSATSLRCRMRSPRVSPG